MIASLNEAISIPEAPAIRGLRWRAFQGDSDYEAMLAVIDASKVVDKIERTQTPEEIRRYYAHLNNCDPYRDMLFIEIDGEVIGYNRVWWEREANGPWLYAWLGFLKPAWRGRGLGTAALAYVERRLRAIAAENGHPEDEPRFFQTFAADSETGREALLREAGYSPVRYGFNMVRSLSGPIQITPLPAGLEVRPVGPELYRAVWEADAEAFRDHWGYVPPTEKDYQAWLNNPNFNAALWQVAFDTASGEVAGMVQNFVNEPENREYRRRRGYTEGISVRRPWRQRGLARALLTRSLQMFQDMGMTEAALGVDADNPNGARRLYESVGFQVARRETVYRKPL